MRANRKAPEGEQRSASHVKKTIVFHLESALEVASDLVQKDPRHKNIYEGLERFVHNVKVSG